MRRIGHIQDQPGGQQLPSSSEISASNAGSLPRAACDHGVKTTRGCGSRGHVLEVDRVHVTHMHFRGT